VIFVTYSPSQVHPATYLRVFWNAERTTWTAICVDGSSFQTNWICGGEASELEEVEDWKR
jgi:hypothetical protein